MGYHGRVTILITAGLCVFFFVQMYTLYVIRKLLEPLRLPANAKAEPVIETIETFRSGTAIIAPINVPLPLPKKPTDGLTVIDGSARLGCPACAETNITRKDRGPTHAIAVDPDEKRLTHRLLHQVCQSCGSEWLVKPG
jgi:hypothetical protein